MVTTPPKRKPRKVREWWIVISPNGGTFLFHTKAAAETDQRHFGGEVVKVREVPR
jgi:hypothetical protein